MDMSGTVNMFTRVKDAVSNVLSEIHVLPQLPDDDSDTDDSPLAVKHAYNRPTFLNFTSADELQVSADHGSRPILVPRDITKLPANSGYAEVINSGKTKLNEDQAHAEYFSIPLNHSLTELAQESPGSSSTLPDPLISKSRIDVTYFGLFDGHAGAGAAVVASRELHTYIKDQLIRVKNLIVERYKWERSNSRTNSTDTFSETESDRVLPSLETDAKSGNANDYDTSEPVSVDQLITGAIEQAFVNMDSQIGEDKKKYRLSGGASTIVALHVFDRLYIANAGDCRAILYDSQSKQVTPLSTDFNPSTERKRILNLGWHRPELLHNEFTVTEFKRRPHRNDLGEEMLYREPWMSGWSFKTIENEDLRFPLIHGSGKKARLLATIGVTRGLGDHDLRVYDSDIYIKPFLSCHPEIKVVHTNHYTDADDVVIIGTDGLWDNTSNEMAASIVQKSFDQFEKNERIRYTSAAQDLVMHSRGLLRQGWRTKNDEFASMDDISVFVIPITGLRDCKIDSATSTFIDETIVPSDP